MPQPNEGGGGGEEDDDDNDDAMFEEVSATLKPGYEEHFVDPDEGWEKPPPEAMRSPRAQTDAAAAAAAGAARGGVVAAV